MPQQVYSVSLLTREIKSLLERSFPRLWVEGEISNLTRHSSGHIYFTLKDENSQIRCAMWRFRAGSLIFSPESGMKVLVEGDVQVYEKNGSYQLIAQQMQPAGIGALQKAFEQLKDRLQKEGLFDESRKRPLPKFPERIGVITSPTGAAIRDIISVLSRRFPGIEIVVYPVRVQGDGAAAEIAEAIADMNEYGEVDLLIIGRGGGSLEDLWAFNEEIVARAIFASQLPIISAVGHEVDFSISDFVADHRAPTPSAAAELAVRSRSELLGALAYYQEKMESVLRKNISQHRLHLDNLQKSYAFRRPADAIYQYAQRLDDLQRNMQHMMQQALKLKSSQVENLTLRIEGLNPSAILQRGYSITSHQEKIVRDVKSVKAGDEIRVKLAKGWLNANVSETGEKDE